MREMSMCDNGHEPIVHQSDECPVCESQEGLSDDVKNLIENDNELVESVAADPDFYREVERNEDEVRLFLDNDLNSIVNQENEDLVKDLKDDLDFYKKILANKDLIRTVVHDLGKLQDLNPVERDLAVTLIRMLKDAVQNPEAVNRVVGRVEAMLE